MRAGKIDFTALFCTRLHLLTVQNDCFLICLLDHEESSEASSVDSDFDFDFPFRFSLKEEQIQGLHSTLHKKKSPKLKGKRKERQKKIRNSFYCVYLNRYSVRGCAQPEGGLCLVLIGTCLGVICACFVAYLAPQLTPPLFACSSVTRTTWEVQVSWVMVSFLQIVWCFAILACFVEVLVWFYTRTWRNTYPLVFTIGCRVFQQGSCTFSGKLCVPMCIFFCRNGVFGMVLAPTCALSLAKTHVPLQELAPPPQQVKPSLAP